MSTGWRKRDPPQGCESRFALVFCTFYDSGVKNPGEIVRSESAVERIKLKKEREFTHFQISIRKRFGGQNGMTSGTSNGNWLSILSEFIEIRVQRTLKPLCEGSEMKFETLIRTHLSGSVMSFQPKWTRCTNRRGRRYLPTLTRRSLHMPVNARSAHLEHF